MAEGGRQGCKSKYKFDRGENSKLIAGGQHQTKEFLNSFHLNAWSHFRISSADLKVRATLYGIINSTTGMYCSIHEAFI